MYLCSNSNKWVKKKKQPKIKIFLSIDCRGEGDIGGRAERDVKMAVF